MTPYPIPFLYKSIIRGVFLTQTLMCNRYFLYNFARKIPIFNNQKNQLFN